MNRRRLFAMLPVLPIAALLPAETARAAPDPVDTRPTFALSDYRICDPDKSYVCDTHDADHHAYTHGCQPIAFPADRDWSGLGTLRPATADAIPIEAHQECPFSAALSFPHQHHDFRWVD